ncbi:MAG: glycosyltransferase family 4 protein [Planctomycetota bacterium]|nr:glycosyltransferase family 4 protein [Planctomycetota bacterium]
MRIAINGLTLMRTMTGIGRTTLHTLRAMLRLNTVDEFFLFLPSDAPEDLDLTADNLTIVPTDVSLTQAVKSVIFEEFQLPLKLRGAKIDLYYAPSFLLPAIKGAAAEVICVHDLAWRVLPQTKSLKLRTYMNSRLPAALKRAARIVCVSEATSADLQKHYEQAGPDRVRVVHNGVDLDVFRPVSGATDEASPYLAVVGNQDPRKNIDNLLEAFPIFRARMRPCRLVMVGPGEPPAVRPPAVDVLGYLDDEELASLYRGAMMVVQPSLYEGFGLPVLEAMACGTPVACADIPVFREVAGDCARYFNPRAPGSIAKTMETLASDEALRAELAEKSAARARGFSWDETAKKLLAVFAEATA